MLFRSTLNEKRIGNYVLAPGWTVYEKRLQYQSYDVTTLLVEQNTLCVTVGKGWYRSRMAWNKELNEQKKEIPAGFFASLEMTYEDGSTELLNSDESWSCQESPIRFSEIYDGEVYDATFQTNTIYSAVTYAGPTETLLPQEGELIEEQEHLTSLSLFQTPTGETIIDFGQNLTGYLALTLEGIAGEIVDVSFAEVLDQDGNFYTDNYRGAKSTYHYICKNGKQTYKPHFTFYGFRYIRINQFPGGLDAIDPTCFTAIVVHSNMKRTGHISCSNPDLNKLFKNIIWGQKGNFLDVPTDCPQRDERLGWTGDAQAFIKTAALNYDVEKFFRKWLQDMVADQDADGGIGHVIPNVLGPENSAAWADASTICPWELYLAYGNPEILQAQFQCMTKWLSYIETHSTTPYAWTGGEHFGDWLGLDAPSGSYKGSTRDDFIATAFYAYSTSLVIKAGKVIGVDVANYETLYTHIVETTQRQK